MAEQRPMPDENHDRTFPWSGLRGSGILWAINRYLFHPRGYAFGLQFENEEGAGEPTGWSLVGEGREPYTFSAKQDDVGLGLFEYFLPRKTIDPRASRAIAFALLEEPEELPHPVQAVIETARIILSRLQSGEGIKHHDKVLLTETLALLDRPDAEAAICGEPDPSQPDALVCNLKPGHEGRHSWDTSE